MKLFHFHENTRPAYYGTWTKTSSRVQGCAPLAEDRQLFDYDVDSDDEWQEEDPGESLSGSEDEGEEEEDVKTEDRLDYEDGWLQHDDEGMGSDDEGVGHSRKRPRLNKSNVARPIILGVRFGNDAGARLGTSSTDTLMAYKVESLGETDVVDAVSVLEQRLAGPCDFSSTPADAPAAKKLTEEMLFSLVEMVHGSFAGREKLADDFILRCEAGTAPSKSKIQKKIAEMAKKEKREGDARSRWYVCADTLQTTGVDGPAIMEQLRSAEAEKVREKVQRKEAEREQKRQEKLNERNREKELKQQEKEKQMKLKDAEKVREKALREEEKAKKENPQRGAMFSFIRPQKQLKMPTAVVDGKKEDFDDTMVGLLRD